MQTLLFHGRACASSSPTSLSFNSGAGESSCIPHGSTWLKQRPWLNRRESSHRIPPPLCVPSCFFRVSKLEHRSPAVFSSLAQDALPQDCQPSAHAWLQTPTTQISGPKCSRSRVAELQVFGLQALDVHLVLLLFILVKKFAEFLTTSGHDQAQSGYDLTEPSTWEVSHS